MSSDVAEAPAAPRAGVKNPRGYPQVTVLRNKAYLLAMAARRRYLRQMWGMTIGDGCRISLSAKLDKTNPRGIVIGDFTAITFGVAILSHDFINYRHTTTTIGSNTFIGARSVIMPGVTVGNNCIVSALSFVARDVPDNCIVMGNPARVVERDIVTGRFGNRVEDVHD